MFMKRLIFKLLIWAAQMKLLQSGCANCKTHQAHKDAEELDHISVRNRVKTSHKGVEDGDQCWDHHWHVDVYVHDYAQSGTYTSNISVN